MGVRRGPSRAMSLGDVRDLPVQTMGLGEDAERFLRGEMPESEAPSEDVERRGSINIGDLLGRYLQLPPTQQEFVARSWADENPDLAGPWKEGVAGGGQPLQQVVTWWGEQAPGFFDFRSQGLSDEERALTGQTGGFTAAPSMASGPGGFSPPPQQLPNAGGFTRSPALSGPGGFARSPLPPFLNTIMAGGGQESLPEMSPEEIAREAQRKINREGLAGARRALEQGPSRVPDHLDDFVPDEDYGGVLEARRESSPLGWLGGRAAEREGRQTYEPGPSKRAYPGAPLTPREPVGDPQSQRTQSMLADMFAQQGAGPEQRTGMVNQVWDSLQNTSWQQRAAMVSALVAAGLITTGTGGMGAPVGAGLLTAAGVGALSTAP